MRHHLFHARMPRTPIFLNEEDVVEFQCGESRINKPKKLLPAGRSAVKKSLFLTASVTWIQEFFWNIFPAGRRKEDIHYEPLSKSNQLCIVQRTCPLPVMLSLPTYPETADLTLDLRPLLHPLFQQLDTGISEFTFANLYLFRHKHHYTVSLLADATLVILGRDNTTPFFMLPFGLPEQSHLDRLFHDHGMMKCASRHQAQTLETRGYQSLEDRDNFDYLYRREDLAELGGRNYHKKRNLIKAFVATHPYSALPLREEYRDDALRILDDWRTETGQSSDYDAAREALEKMEELQLCGGIYYVESRPVAYTLGEELPHGDCFVIHFEKAVSGYKGLYQFINKSFAAILPEIYQTINREQDLGAPGLRKAKLSYKPAGFIEKFKIIAP